MTCGIYKITCNETGKCYIGQSIDIEKRWRKHYRRFNKEYFTYEILLSCEVDWLDFFEKAFISGYDSHRNGFNQTIGGSSIKVKYPSEETRRKLSDSLIGNKRQKKNHTNETRKKMSEAAKNRPPRTEEYKNNISIGQHKRTDVKGYSWHKRLKKFQAKIRFDNKVIHLGSFDTEAEARQAYLDAKQNII